MLLDMGSQVAAPSVTRVIDARAVHARILWDNGWGRGRFKNFEAYVSSIPRIPVMPRGTRFNKLVLVDTTLVLTDACRVLGIEYGGDNTVFTHYPNRPPPAEAYWMWMQDGESTLGLSGFDCVSAAPAKEIFLTAAEGVCWYAGHTGVLFGRSVELPGSRLGSFPVYSACLMVHEGQPTLGVTEYCVGSPDRGSASAWGG